MPGITELEQLSKSYSLAIALLLCGCVALAYTVLKLYRENQQLWSRIALILEKRFEVLDSFMESSNAKHRS
jgi:hypothetical protein